MRREVGQKGWNSIYELAIDPEILKEFIGGVCTPWVLEDYVSLYIDTLLIGNYLSREDTTDINKMIKLAILFNSKYNTLTCVIMQYPDLCKNGEYSTKIKIFYEDQVN